MKRAKTLLILISLLSLMGCMPSDLALSEVPIAQHIFIQSAEDMNEGTPVAVDIVLTTNPQLASQLSTLPASGYFLQKTQIIKDYPGQVFIAGWEVIPGHQLNEVMRPGTHRAPQGFIFADYRVPGAHRAVLPPYGRVGIQLLRQDFRVIQVP